MMKKYFTWVCAVAMLSSCIKGEPLNQECDIVSAYLEGEQYAALFYQPSQMRQDNIPSASKDIVFSVKSMNLLPDRLPVSQWIRAEFQGWSRHLCGQIGGWRLGTPVYRWI